MTEGAELPTEVVAELNKGAEEIRGMTREEVFSEVNWDAPVGVDKEGKRVSFKEKIDRQKQIFQKHMHVAFTSISPAVLVEGLWPSREFVQSAYGEVMTESLRPLSRIWQSLNAKVKEIFGTSSVNLSVVKLDKSRNRRLKEEALEESTKVVEAIASTECMDVHFQTMEDSLPAFLAGFWEPWLAVVQKLGVKNLSLHSPYLVNLNPTRGENKLFNLRHMLVTGFISTEEREGLVDRGYSTDEIAAEQEKRATMAYNASEQQIRWWEKIKADPNFAFAGGNITLHLAPVDKSLSEVELSRGIKSLQELKKLTSEGTEILVETQGLTAEQLERVFREVPEVGIVFDIAHVAIEAERYGDVMQALEKYKDKIRVIHFTQPVAKGDVIIDQHNQPHQEGLFSDDEMRQILRFADSNKIWVTFESGFEAADVDKIFELLGEEPVIKRQ